MPQLSLMKELTCMALRLCENMLNLLGSSVVCGPQVDCCIRCLAQGVNATHIIDGRQQHSLLMELLTNEGVGTMITG